MRQLRCAGCWILNPLEGLWEAGKVVKGFGGQLPGYKSPTRVPVRRDRQNGAGFAELYAEGTPSAGVCIVGERIRWAAVTDEQCWKTGSIAAVLQH